MAGKLPDSPLSNRGSFSLQHDLEALQRVLDAQAYEAAVFYAGRILEVLASQAVEDLGIASHATILSNLDLLEQYNLVPVAARYAGHALRRLSNDARHVLRPLSASDAHLSRLFALLSIEWYFHSYLFGPHLPQPSGALPQGSKGVPGGSASAAAPFAPVSVIHELLSACAHADSSELSARIEREPQLAQTPAIPAVLAEAMMDCGRLGDAKVMIDRALARFANDTRLELLRGLQLSRSEDLNGALGVLEPLYRRFRGDSEAAGILAGVYKRQWLKEGDAGWLKKSHDTYIDGWKASRETSAYLGTNAAATALWLGNAERSRELAAEVQKLVTERNARLAQKIADPEASMGFWNAATMAELRLLNGDVEGAREAYWKLFARHAGKKGMIEVARRQAELILGERASGFFQERDGK
ncbi:MAG TPA: tetratricopeptide repeat-containing protein [Phycisphaerae bacterium]|nr:tetratricopeptide repeat-containing protein [Phycisphaerae bacterium]